MQFSIIYVGEPNLQKMFLRLLRDRSVSIQICRSRCKSTSTYLAAEASSEVGVDLKAGSGFEKPEAGLREPRIAVPNILAGFFFCSGSTKSKKLIQFTENNRAFLRVFLINGHLQVERSIETVLNLLKQAVCSIGCGAFRIVIEQSTQSTTS